MNTPLSPEADVADAVAPPRSSAWRRLRPDGVWLLPQRLAVVILAVVVVGYGLFAVVGIAFAGLGVVATTAALACAVVATATQWAVSRPAARPGPAVRGVLLLVLALTLLGPIVATGPIQHGLPGFLAGSALLLLPLAVGVPVAVGVVVVVTLLSGVNAPIASDLGSIFALIYTTTATITAAMAVFGLSTLVRVLHEAHAAHEELGRAAVADARLRFTRRVHDLLGQGLSEILLRGQLVTRLLDRARAARADPERGRAGAAEELDALLTRSRAALTDVRSVAAMRDEPPEDPRPSPSVGAVRLAPRLAAALLVVVAVDFGVVAVGGLVETSTVGRALVGLPLAVVAAAVMVGLMLMRTRRRWVAVALLVLLAALVYVPMPWLGPLWHGLPAFLGGAALIALPPRPGFTVFAATWASAVLVEYLDPAPSPSLAYSLSYTAAGFLVASLVLFGLGLVPRLLVELVEARADLDRLAVAREHVRLSRDLHDLLGLSLSTVTLKCELSRRLLDPAPEQARTELAFALDAARTALVETRRVGRDEEPLSLEQECVQVRQTLESAHIDVRLDLVEPLPGEPTSTVLAAVVREAATNVLRHSDAVSWRLVLRREPGRIELEMVNDGVHADEERADETDPDGPVPEGVTVGGNGMPNMTRRVAALGGTVEADRDEARYRLVVRVPDPPAVARAPAG